MSAWSNTQMLSSASKSMIQIEDLGRLCYQNNIEKKDIFLIDQIIKSNMSAEVQYLLDHKSCLILCS